MISNPQKHAKLEKIKLLILDVDGILTDGSVIYNDRGEETKVFNAKDGLGVRMLMDAGIGVCIVSGRRSPALIHRCRNLGISSVFDGVADKASVFNSILASTGIAVENTAAMGDDLPDLPLLRMAGCAISVADGRKEVRGISDFVTHEKGGDGAVRAICEEILKAQGCWEAAIAKWQ